MNWKLAAGFVVAGIISAVAFNVSALPNETASIQKVKIVGADGSVNPTLPIHEQGYKPTTRSCVEVVASSVGDGGVLGANPDGSATSVLTTGGRYVLTVTDDSPVRLLNGGACNSFSGGVGEIIPAGALLDWTAQAAPDGGAPAYSACAKTATTGYPIVQLCPQAN